MVDKLLVGRKLAQIDTCPPNRTENNPPTVLNISHQDPPQIPSFYADNQINFQHQIGNHSLTSHLC